MDKWYNKGHKSYGEMPPEDKKEFWRDIRRELWHGWLILFVIQLVMGVYHLYHLWPEFADIPLWGTAFIWALASAIMATILLPAVVFLMFLAAAIVFGIMHWRETRNG